MHCQGCRRPITDQYQQAMGKAWHPQCFTCTHCKRPIPGGFVVENKQPFHEMCLVCAGCQKPLAGTPFVRHGGKPWHATCHSQKHGKRCSGCHQAIEGPMLQALDGHWHPNCFRCGRCNQPISDKKFLPKQDQAYHEACYHQTFTRPCDVCKTPMVKGGLQDAWGNTFCKEHKQKLPSCFSCGRIICAAITSGGKRYEDGRTVCNLCSASAVKDQQQALALLAQVRQTMGELGFPLKEETPFRLVDRAELDRFKKSKRKERPVMGMARSTKTLDSKGRVHDRQFEEIIVLYGMPEEHFNTVVAHELCHAWLFFNHFDGLPLKVEEGLCTLTEFLYLSQLSTQEAKIRIEMLKAADDAIYGAGFRAAYKAWRKLKLPALLKHVKQKKRFPGGLALLFS